MIRTVNFPSPDGNNSYTLIPAIVRQNVALYPIFDEGFSYILRHTLTGKLFGESATRSAAIKALRELSALHSWDFTDPQETRNLPPDLPVKTRNIVDEAYNFPNDEGVHPAEIIYDALLRRARRGKPVNPELLEKVREEYFDLI